MTRLCRWSCRRCPATGASRTPVAAWAWHWANAHDATTTTRLSIYEGTMR